MRCVLIGNYGDANFGDEMLREYFLTRFPQVSWTVVSARPGKGEVARLPFGLRSLFSPWWKTVSAIRHADAVVFGGGTLFTDIESVRACGLWWLHAKAARLLGIKRIFAFQGIGPFKTGLGRWFALSALRGAALVTARDGQGMARVQEMLPNTEVVQTFDPVFSLFEEQKKGVRTGNVLGIIPRLNSGESFTQTVHAEWGSGKYESARILSFQPDEAGERVVCERIRAVTGVATPVVSVRTLAEAIDAYAGLGLILTHRYHGAIVGMGMGIPLKICSQAEGDKLWELEREMAEGVDVLRKRIQTGEQKLLEMLGV